MLIILILLLFFLKFFTENPYINYLIAVCLVVGVFVIGLLFYVVNKLALTIELEDRNYQQGDDIVFSLIIDKPYFHTLLMPIITFINQQTGEETVVMDMKIIDDQAQYHLSSLHAGTIRMEINTINVFDLFKTFYFPKKTFYYHVFNIYPSSRLVDIKNLKKDVLINDGEIQNKKGDDYSEIYEVRPMEEGDDLRFIHRSLSARYDDYIIRVGSATEKTYYTFTLNHDPDFSKEIQEMGQLVTLCQTIINKETYCFALTYNGQLHMIYSSAQLYDFMDKVYLEYVK